MLTAVRGQCAPFQAWKPLRELLVTDGRRQLRSGAVAERGGAGRRGTSPVASLLPRCPSGLRGAALVWGAIKPRQDLRLCPARPCGFWRVCRKGILDAERRDELCGFFARQVGLRRRHDDGGGEVGADRPDRGNMVHLLDDTTPLPIRTDEDTSMILVQEKMFRYMIRRRPLRTCSARPRLTRTCRRRAPAGKKRRFNLSEDKPLGLSPVPTAAARVEARQRASAAGGIGGGRSLRARQ